VNEPFRAIRGHGYKRSSVVWSRSEAAVLNVKDGIYYGLDPVGAHIWKLLQTPCKVADIQEALLQEYDVDPERCQRDLMALLEELLGAG
jgi:coenzyme PQQ synthesis protein D (PqqD)